MSSAFTLHPQLARDTFDVGRLALSRVLLMNDRRWPWLILVPERPGLRDLCDLASDDAARLMTEIVAASALLRDLHRPYKINVAALGNQVDQLHVHVIARFQDDAAWPRPVWGIGASQPYAERERDASLDTLRAALARLPAATPSHP